MLYKENREKYCDAILKEEYATILRCLDEQECVFAVEKTNKGYRFLEKCECYYGVTLTQEQFERLIGELQQLAKKEITT